MGTKLSDIINQPLNDADSFALATLRMGSQPFVPAGV